MTGVLSTGLACATAAVGRSTFFGADVYISVPLLAGVIFRGIALASTVSVLVLDELGPDGFALVWLSAGVHPLSWT